jgi:hypothetical protein
MVGRAADTHPVAVEWVDRWMTDGKGVGDGWNGDKGNLGL